MVTVCRAPWCGTLLAMQSSTRESIQTVCWPTGPSLDGGGGIVDLRDWDAGELRSYLRQLALGIR